ncbi:MAG TPA: tRNA (adenosine(37)-N6)-threonylcarbamoyltransferase complex ATPase subunit type 1 TsaE [Roseiarcus sp.]|nr:tRNA (adenosine(37)-N6)-threonylcarbamoyltransferase complex ATPase subunit type 1 TsaE [Roseiarcus sp.]
MPQAASLRPVDSTWEVELPDERATTAFAEGVAEWLKAGDLVTLSGDLGAGKTTFARALMRALTGDPNLEAPSPTFTLMQIYDGPGYPIVHADFYRIRSADELVNLGWEEASEGALVLVEWPQRASEALSGDRLDVAIALAPELGPEARRATLTGYGTFIARLAHARGVAAILRRAGWSDAKRVFMQGDASVRAYERLSSPDGETAILMISPPRPDGPILRYGKPYAAIAKLADDIRAFIAMDEALSAQGLSAPRLYAHSIANGLAVLEDFGDAFIADAYGPIPERYSVAVEVLAELHDRDLPIELPVDGETYTLRPYDAEAMLVEVELALEWYAPHVAKTLVASGARAQFLSLWRETLAPILAGPMTWTLRDYHSPNLLWLAEREGLQRVGLIDFQDCLLGPPAYDVAALLQDARVDVDDALELKLMAQYTRRRLDADRSFDINAFVAAYAVMGAQRATKILGLFARLDKRDGKPQYLAHLPRIERALAKSLAHPLLSPINLWHQTHLPRALGVSA